MKDGEEWVMRPAIERVCLYESLKSGLLDLEDVARMNAAIDVKYENENRLNKANQRKGD
jgi:uncharacterized protein DUF6889